MGKMSKIIRFVKRLFPKTPKMKFMYAWYYKHAAVKEHQALFESFHGKDVSDSPLAILQDFLKMPESQKFTIYFATNDMQRDQEFINSIGLKVKLVDISTFKYTKVLATSKYLINNSSFPAYFIRRPQQIYLQTWHGTPLKTLGKKMKYGIESMYNVQHNFLHANYIMFPNEFTKKAIMEDYNLESLYTGKVIMNGYPRNSIFMNKEKAEEVREKLGNDQYTTLAYMPTWRGKSNHDVDTAQYSKEVNKLLTYLDDNLKSHQKLYVNFHPMVQKFIKLDDYKHIYSFPQGVDKYEFLNSVDALITDYSSVFFDYSITRKPVILYMYDYDEYMHDRGMYFDIKELPFRKIYDAQTLLNCIVKEEFRNDSYDHDDEYIQKYIQYDSADASRKMAELVFRESDCGMPVVNYCNNLEKKRNILYYPEIKKPEAIDTIAKIVDKNKDVVIFEKRFFNPELSSYLHDNYRDDFDFIFITRTLPRTYFEELVRKKSKKISDKLHLREVKRCFAELNVNPKFQKNYYHGEAGETYHLGKTKNLAATMFVESDGLHIDFANARQKKITKLLVVNFHEKIIWTRQLTEQEKESNQVIENFYEIMNSQLVAEKARYLLMLEVEEAGKKVPYYLKDQTDYKKRMGEFGELDKQSIYLEAIPYQHVFYRNCDEPAEGGVIPYVNSETGRFALFFATKQQQLRNTIRGRVMKLRLHNSLVKMTLKFKKQKSAKIKDVIFSYRNPVEDLKYSFDYQVREKNGFWFIDAEIDVSKIQMEELFWDVFLVLEKDGIELNLWAYLSRIRRLSFLLLNYQAFADKNHICFPYSTITCKLAFTYREVTEFDGMNTRLKELFAFGIYILFYPYWKRKRIWLVFEKFCSMAQDNGYYFFKYCMDKLPESRRHMYFILSKDSADFKKLKDYGENVLPFMSLKHILYSLAANLYIASDSKKHLYTWRTKPSIIANRISKHDILFLQHGVTALKRVDHIFGRKGSSAMTYFTTTSKFEQKIITENFGYAAEDAPILGFTRWDVLEDKSNAEEKIILAMPTWRAWLEERSAEEFKKSDYYFNYMKLLQSEKLARLLKENNVNLIFYIHPKFKDYLGEFNVSGDHIELIPFGSRPLNEIMMKCSMLITDYSSVCWDVYYMRKPVLFYQFDYDMYMQAHGSYIDMEHDLFGERYVEYTELINGIEAYIRKDFEIKEKDAENIDYYFEYRDAHNSKRTYDYIIGKGY